jgi:hypothetical protein
MQNGGTELDKLHITTVKSLAGCGHPQATYTSARSRPLHLCTLQHTEPMKHSRTTRPSMLSKFRLQWQLQKQQPNPYCVC